MGVNLLYKCLIFQTLIAATLGELVLPFTDLVATVTPIKPKSAALSIGEFQLPPIPNIPNLSEVILDYFISQFPETDLNLPIVCKFASPLMVTSTSRGLPASNSEITNINGAFVDNLNPRKSNVNERSPCINIPLPLSSPISLPVVPQYVPEIHFIDTNLACPLKPDLSIISSGYTPECLSPLAQDVIVPNILRKSLPDNTNNFICEPNFGNSLALCSSPTAALGVNPSYFHSPPNQNLFSFGALPSIDPAYSLPYPLRCELLSLPTVTPSIDIPLKSPTYLYNDALPITLNIKPIIKVPSATFHTTNCGRYSQQSERPAQLVDLPILQPIQSILSLPVDVSKNVDPYAIELPDFEPNPFEFTPISFEFDSTPHFIKNFDCNIEYINEYAVPNMFPVIDTFIDNLDFNLENNFRYCQESIDTLHIPEVPDIFSEFIPLPDICTKTTLPEIHSPKLASKKNLAEPCSSAIIYQPTPYTTITPCTFINVSPSCSSAKTISAVNDMVSTVVKNLLAEYTSYLKSGSVKPLPSNPYVVNQFKRNTRAPLSPPISITPLSTPYTIPPSRQCVSVPTIPLNTCYNFVPSTPSIAAKPASSIYTEINPRYDGCSSTYPYMSPPDLTSEVIEASSSAPMKVTILPQSSFADYSAPQPCPSFLPSPIISSNIDMPYMIEPQIVKLKPTTKKSKTLEFLEMICLSKLLKNNENVDCDALDTVMALLGP